jgi:hypothetical protein
VAASSAAAYPARLPGSGPLDDPRAGAILQPGIQIEDVGGIRIVQAGFPSLAHRAVTGDQLRCLDDAPPCGMRCGRRCQHYGSPEALSAAEADDRPQSGDV